MSINNQIEIRRNDRLSAAQFIGLQPTKTRAELAVGLVDGLEIFETNILRVSPVKAFGFT